MKLRKQKKFVLNFLNLLTMKNISNKHAKGALGLRIFGLGPNFKPTRGLLKLQRFLNKNAFWAKIEQ